tara:strand:- start:122 stop:1306 length:1185 start_codon:yes stop_codon:yes gene_type:complete
MFLETLFVMFIGVCLGIITGLIPGIHVNLISVLLLSFSAVLMEFLSPLLVAVIIVSMAVTHTFLDTIPSVFLGAPEAETAMGILPGHRLLLAGKGFEAVMLTVLGSLLSLLIAVLCVPFLLPLVEAVYPVIKNWIGWILVIVCAFMLFREKNKFWALIVFAISGAMGLIVLNMSIDDVLFPLFSGLFGVSMLIYSLKDKIHLPEQVKTSIETKGSAKAIGCSVVVGWVSSFLPGLGPAQAAVIGSQFVALSEKSFLVLVGGLSTVNMVLSLVTFYVLDKARNGAIVAVQELIAISYIDFLILLCVALTVGGIASMLAIFLTKVFSKIVSKVDYSKLCIGVIVLIVVLVCLITKWLGLLILITAAAIGIIAPIKNVSRSQMMACLLIPVIGYFLF